MYKSFVYDNKDLADFLTQEYFPKYFDYDSDGVLVPKTYYYQKMYSDSNTFTSWCCLDPTLIDNSLKEKFENIDLGKFDIVCRVVQFSSVDASTVKKEVGRNNSGMIMNLSDTECSFRIYEPKTANLREHRTTSILTSANKADLRLAENLQLNRNILNIVDFTSYKEFYTSAISTCIFFNFKTKSLQDMKNLLVK